VTLTKPFELGVYEVTQEQYEKVKGTNPSSSKGPQNPVEKVSWEDAVEFCRKLSELPEEKAAGRVYRLPTEAEWEYACRAGTTTAYSFGDDESQLRDYAWFSGNATHPVGQKKPNPWGLYDMHGNVWEWCQDSYGAFPQGLATDPKGPSSGSYRVYRGGSWNLTVRLCRSSSRSRCSPSYHFGYLGFRVVCVPSSQ
jgi:formylglycine-generating enzyme required for sulfatase activity